MGLRRAAALACAVGLLAAPASAAAAAPAASPGRDVAAQARQQARDVLAQRRFKPGGLPAPLRRPRERIGEGLRSLGRPLQDLFVAIAALLPGGAAVLWALLAALVLGGATALASRAAARRVRVGEGRAASARELPSAAELLAQAARAEARGDLDAALRLRFRAGLVELDARELIELRPSLTNQELTRAVRSPTLAGLVEGFESVAYGGRAAQPEDVSSAREGWPRVPAEAASR